MATQIDGMPICSGPLAAPSFFACFILRGSSSILTWMSSRGSWFCDALADSRNAYSRSRLSQNIDQIHPSQYANPDWKCNGLSSTNVIIHRLPKIIGVRNELNFGCFFPSFYPSSSDCCLDHCCLLLLYVLYFM